MQNTRTVQVDGESVTFHAVPEQGAWYETAGLPNGTVGTLYAPMLADGSFDENDIGEIEVTYEEAAGAAVVTFLTGDDAQWDKTNEQLEREATR